MAKPVKEETDHAEDLNQWLGLRPPKEKSGIEDGHDR
jgi:hypothetical protein